MLYLVRKIDESIIINENIEVKVVEIKGKSVKLGFEFPSTATVLRKEIHDRVVAENIAAALAQGDDDLDIADAIAQANIEKDVDGNKSEEED